MIEAQGAVPTVFAERRAALTARFPDFGACSAVLGFVYSKVEVGLPFLIRTANLTGMTVFSWAAHTLHRPGFPA